MDTTNSLPKLLENILKSKGLNNDHLTALAEAGIQQKADFEMIGDTQTLIDITGLDEEIAHNVMLWAVGVKTQQEITPNQDVEISQQQPIVVESADVVKCVHCGTKQPKDYKTGDLCVSCGNQAEPVLNCHWCFSSGPGKFCRSCGSEFVPSADFELALFLKREGESKNAIVKMVKEMTPQEKENMWARIRKNR